jgi:hypothetical protein
MSPRRQAKPEVPRWRRGRQKPPAPQINLSARQQKKLVGQVSALAASGALNGTVIPLAAGSRVMARTGAFRFRYQLVPVAWILFVLAAGMGAYLRHSVRGALFVAIIVAIAIVLLTRHLSEFARNASLAMAVLTFLWVPVLALDGLHAPLPPLLFACWLAVLVPWAKRYRIRREVMQVPDVTDHMRWERLAAKNRWTGNLGLVEDLPGGGRQYPIILDGAETHIGQVMSEPRKIAAAWGKSMTEAYAEPSPDGIESRGLLTILSRNTLEKAREWNGTGIDPETGMAVVGRFPDGQPVHERYFIRRNGVRHTIVAGADGSGKTGLLDLGLCLSATSGLIAPVILDPQEGQALPAWTEHVPYASGAEMCMEYLYGLHAGLLARSRYLGALRWTTEDGDERKGMGFFDAAMTGLPIIEITLDEAPALLSASDPKIGSEALRLLADIGKRGRKAGFRLRLAIQVPSLSEFGGNAQALRSMLVGGNVFCGRTGDRVSGGMIGINAEPSQLPKYFADGEPTVGLGYGDGPDNRPSTPLRWDWVPDPYKVARSANIRGLDERCAEAMDRVMSRRGAQLPLPAAAPLAAVPPVEDDKPGRSAADAILAVLTSELDRGHIIAALRDLAGEWGRPSPWKARAIGDALGKLTSDGKITKTGHGTYAPVRASLHAVSRTATETTEAG